VFLKTLEIFGFKSFADKVQIEFSDGVAALLGPNGCGKSNVVDAMKWVLGEQSSKSLRAENMHDIIFAGSETRGSAFHDEIVWDEAAGIRRPTNRAGGLEGGVTNGEEIRALAVVKPIPTLLIALRSVDLATREPRKASVERSDTCVVPAAGVVAEAMLALVLADALLEKTGGDSLDEVLAHLESTRALQRRIAGPR